MAIEITVPTLGESVADATVARWMKSTGDAVAADEPVVELETDKVTLEVPAPAAGTMGEIIAAEGANVEVGAVLGMLNDGRGIFASGCRQVEAACAHPRIAPAAAPAAASRTCLCLRQCVAWWKKISEPSGHSWHCGDGRLTKADVLAHMKGGSASQSTAPAAAPAASAAPRIPSRGRRRTRGACQCRSCVR